MQWYLLKTWIGREEELVKEIRRTVPSYMYEDVFVIYTERIWRRQGRSIVHPEPLFRGCAFLTCREPGPIWRRLERVPFLSGQMAAGDLTVYPLREEDARFLWQVSGDEHLMRLSYVLRETDGPADEAADTYERSRSTYRVSGPLEHCLENIDSIEFRKRFVKLRKRLWGEDLVIAMGIVLNEDLGHGLVYEDPEADAAVPDGWTMLEIRKDADGKRKYVAGERNYPAEKAGYSADEDICPADGIIYPADGSITLLPDHYGRRARVG